MMKKFLFIYVGFAISIYLVLPGCKDSITAANVDNRVMPQSNISFNVDLQPVFQLKCSNSGCHDDGTMAGGLSLTSCVNAKSDPGVIVTGSSKTSIIVWAIEGQAGIQSNISFNVDLQPVFQLKCSNSGCRSTLKLIYD